MKDTFNIKGHLDIRVFSEKGKLKDHRKVNNTVKAAGLHGLLNQTLASPEGAYPKVGWMAVGTGSPQATLLGTEVDRNALTSKTLSTGAVLTMVGDWAAGDATGALTEAGLFDVVTANTVNMWCSASFSVVNKGANDTLTITWTLTLS